MKTTSDRINESLARVNESNTPYQQSAASFKESDWSQAVRGLVTTYATLCDRGGDEEETFNQVFRKFDQKWKDLIKKQLVDSGGYSS